MAVYNDIAAGGDQSFAIEGFGQLLWRTYEESIKENNRKKLFDIEMKLYDGYKAILFKRCNVLYPFIKQYSNNYY